MKHFIFVVIASFWKILPQKIYFSRLLGKDSKLKRKLYQDLRFKGEMNVSIHDVKFKLYNPGITTIENEIFWFGLKESWEKVSLDIWSILSKKSKIILDIGSNTGVYAIIAAKLNPNARVIAFEPVKRTFSVLEKNIEINELTNINAYLSAVSNTNGKTLIYDVTSDSQYSASLNKDMLKNEVEVVNYEVDVLRVDSLKDLFNQKIDLIKIDVEMHEPEVIEGMINMITEHKPSIIIEILNDSIAEKIENLLQGLDYQFYNIDEINAPIKAERLSKSNHFNFLICTSEVADFLGFR
jgi:FkbM family methyltransferase